MNEIEIKLTLEQIQTLQKLLMPYVELSQTINVQYQQQKVKEIKNKEVKANG